MAQDVFRRARTSLIWLFVDSWVGLVVGLISTLILARLLGPEVFGIMALAGAVTGVASIFVGSTLTESLKQKEALEPEHTHTIFWVNFILCGVFAGFFALTARWIGIYFSSQTLADIIPWIALTAFIGSLSNVPDALIERTLDLRRLIVFDTATDIAASIVAVSLAFLGFGVWSLVYSLLFAAIVGTIGTFILAKWRPRLVVSMPHWGDLHEFNLNTVALNFLGYLDDALPQLALGVFIGERAVGVYSLALRISGYISGAVMGPFGELSMTVSARLQTNVKDLRVLIGRVFELTTFALYPAVVGAILVAPLALPILFGPDWSGLVPVTQIALIIGVRHATGDFNFAILRGLGASDVPVKIMLVGIGFLIAFMPAAISFGTVGVITLVACRMLLTWPISANWVRAYTGYRAINQFIVGWRSLIASLIMAGGLIAIQNAWRGTMPDAVLLAATILVGIFIYFIVFLVFWRRELVSGVRTLRRGEHAVMETT